MSRSFHATIKHKNLVDLLRWRGEHQPEQRAYTFLVDGETEAVDFTYGELNRRAGTIAARLQQMNLTGERVLLPYPPGLEFIEAFFGCLYAGVVAVPIHPPPRQQAMGQLAAIFNNAQASLLLTTDSQLAKIEPWLDDDSGLKTARWLTTTAVNDDLVKMRPSPDPNGNSLAFLQYTSGSTAAPKGVMLTHRHLMDNLRCVIESAGFTPENHREGVSWLPPYHDLGLVGFICLGVYTGRPATLMSPVAFMQKPLRWLEAISRTKATYSAAPNFAYDLCVDAITVGQMADLDLSSWEIAIIGSEPIRPKTLDRFAKAFAPCGFRKQAFYPAYGVSEATLVISGGAQSALPMIRTVQGQGLKNNQVIAASIEDDDSRQLVGCGTPLQEHNIIIVDPQTLAPCPPEQVGEIWVSGPSVAQGYWNQPEETQRTFQAHLPNGDGPFLRTGDLGFLKEDELFITGRCKDLIIIRGRNYYPQDIELAAEESHPALRFNSGAAFSVDVDDREQLVIVFELERRHRKANVEEVAAAIRAAVAQAHNIETYAVVLIKTGYLPKTASGKIQRYQCRRQFLENTLPVIGISMKGQAGNLPDPQISEQDTTSDAEYQHLRQQLEIEVRTNLAQFLQVSPAQIDLQNSIHGLGLGSLHATAVKYQLESNFGIELSPEIFFEDITLDQFITKIANLSISPEKTDS